MINCKAFDLNVLNDIIPNMDDLIMRMLTVREKEILALVAKGASNKEIAMELVVREITVKTHLYNIFKKLKVTNRTQAALLYKETK